MDTNQSQYVDRDIDKSDTASSREYASPAEINHMGEKV
jgi:hypothetical protein